MAKLEDLLIEPQQPAAEMTELCFKRLINEIIDRGCELYPYKVNRELYRAELVSFLRRLYLEYPYGARALKSFDMSLEIKDNVIYIKLKGQRGLTCEYRMHLKVIYQHLIEPRIKRINSLLWKMAEEEAKQNA